ncbi:YncE family protein [Pedobacter metabolipauper]|uniref:YVTN family beta-propeller protein n=1 Tax=Pedobacter metabolipauper TaxID=425513 RepID=A0A4V3D1Q0_9SPHI|nr:DUF5074 domain-containing protein [Pedobacter metabolipauper]TDQ12063.1 hypothetical protein ATK78_1194 [Pedobacter metabolipauper]
MNKTTLNYGKLIAMSLIGISTFTSCKKDRGLVVLEPVPTSTLGIYVLCEGPYGTANNSSITYYDAATGTSDKDYFKKQNNTDLGTNANDLKLYGSKMYCVITGTTFEAKDSYLEVISIATGKSIKRISLSDAAAGFLPRFIVFNKNKAYVSGYDGSITKIDTASLTIDGRLKVGGALEEVAVVNNKLYVTNSAHFQFGTADNSSVSVVDLNTFTKTKDITVGFNPTRISATNSGDLFVLTKGNYADIKPSLDKINSISDTKTGTNDKVSLEFLRVTGTKGFVIGDYLDPYFKSFNLGTGELESNFITDATVINSPYGVTINTFNNEVLVSDANFYGAEGKVIGFTAAGVKKFEFKTGSAPQTAVFNYSYK